MATFWKHRYVVSLKHSDHQWRHECLLQLQWKMYVCCSIIYIDIFINVILYVCHYAWYKFVYTFIAMTLSFCALVDFFVCIHTFILLALHFVNIFFYLSICIICLTHSITISMSTFICLSVYTYSLLSKYDFVLVLLFVCLSTYICYCSTKCDTTFISQRVNIL